MTTGDRGPGVWFFSVLILATLAHLGYRAARLQRTKTVPVSDLAVGTPLPDFQLAPARAASDPLPSAIPGFPDCWVLVVFSPECPHCHTAALRDAAQPAQERLPTIWVGQGSQEANARFADGLPSGVPVFASVDVRARLQVRAFPAAFLVGSGRLIKLIFPYQGAIPKSRLQGFCAGGGRG
jgi:hypothetical protein